MFFSSHLCLFFRSPRRDVAAVAAGSPVFCLFCSHAYWRGVGSVVRCACMCVWSLSCSLPPPPSILSLSYPLSTHSWRLSTLFGFPSQRPFSLEALPTPPPLLFLPILIWPHLPERKESTKRLGLEVPRRLTTRGVGLGTGGLGVPSTLGVFVSLLAAVAHCGAHVSVSVSVCVCATALFASLPGLLLTQTKAGSRLFVLSKTMGQSLNPLATHDPVPEEVKQRIPPVDYTPCPLEQRQTDCEVCEDCGSGFGFFCASVHCDCCGRMLCTRCCPPRYLLRDNPACQACTQQAYRLRRAQMLQDHYATAGVKGPAPPSRPLVGQTIRVGKAASPPETVGEGPGAALPGVPNVPSRTPTDGEPEAAAAAVAESMRL